MKNTAHIEKIIENQFPNVYLEEGMPMVEFVKAYYAYMEENHSENKEILDDIDIDETVEDFVQNFKNTYLKDFPFITATDTRFMIKHIMDYYRSKGTIESTQLLLRMLFNEESDVYVPSQDIFKASDSQWYTPTYIEVERNARSVTFLNKQIMGSRSKAKAIVEGVVTKRVNGRYIDVIYLSSIKGTFVYGEKVSDDGVLSGAPTTVGSLTSIKIENGGRNNVVGDILDVVGAGVNGKVRVSEVEDATGRVDFNLVAGGSGYTTTPTTDIYISDGVLNLDNSDMAFIPFETVSQKMETLDLISANGIAASATSGNYMVGVNAQGAQVANGTILQSSQFLSGSTTTILQTSLLINSGTFDRQEKINLTTNATFLVGETLEEQSEVTLQLTDVVGTIAVGRRIEQVKSVDFGALTATITLSSTSTPYTLRETVVQYNANNDVSVSGEIIAKSGNTIKIRGINKAAGPGSFLTGKALKGLSSQANVNVTAVAIAASTELYTNFAFGTVSSVSGNTITINPAWGIFTAGLAVKTYANNTTTVAQATAAVQGADVTQQGSRGVISTKTANSVTIENIFGSFTNGKKVRGDRSFTQATVSSVLNEGATDVWLNGVNTANGVIDLIANTTAQATVIGQNTTAIGVSGNTSPFFSFSDTTIEQSLTEISNMTATVGNIATFTTTVNPNSFVIGNTVLLDISFFQGGEVKYLSGIYAVTARTASTFSVAVSAADGATIRAGSFNISTSSALKTVPVPVKTDRVQLISPPRNANGSIIDLATPVISISTGSGASFEIGSLENEETVFLATDIIGANNAIGVPYLGVRIDGANSGIGFVNSMIVNTAGTGYSNGEIVAFIGGGFASGSPLKAAQGVLATNGSGAIVDVTIIDHGQGYWGEPTYNISSGNATANMSIVMDYGYGFPKLPNGDNNTLLMDLWTEEQFTIGSITSLSRINPGVNYNTDPFVNVYNKYIAGYGRTDFTINLSYLDGSFRVGETITQTIPGDGAETYAKGYILSATSSQIVVRRTSFNTGFNEAYNIVGSKSGAIGYIESVTALLDSNVMGDNAIVTGTVISANGIATAVEVIDSGFGYVKDEPIELDNPDSPFVVSGVSLVASNGIGTGFWKSETSHLNSTSRIHDNYYYQEFSYEVIVGRSVNRYQNILKNVLHVAGSAIFGRVEKRNTGSLVSKASTSINITTT
jgi:hypothetical protein